MTQNSQDKRHISFHSAKIVREGFITRLIFLVLLIFATFSVLSGIYLYLHIYEPLTSDYNTSISAIAQFKDSLLMKTTKIYTFFFIFTVAGIVVLGILYTHRIAGPMHRVKIFARSVTEGNIGSLIKFRSKDVIHSLAYTLNKMSETLSDRLLDLDTDLKDLEIAINELSSSEPGGKSETAAHKIAALNKKIRISLNEIKHD